MTVMGGFGMAGQDRGPGPTGKKRPRSATPCGEQATRTASPCDLCGLSGRFPSHSTPNYPLPTRLRVALVDSDQSVHDFVRQAFEAHANGWVLDSHLTPHSALGGLGSMSATEHSARSKIPTRRDIPHSQPPPDVVLMGAWLPGLSGIDCARRLTARLPNARIVMFTACTDHDMIVESLMAGALGYLIKPVAPAYLVWAVAEAAQARPVLCSQAQAALIGFVCRVDQTRHSKALSWREREVMLLVMIGAQYKEIASKLSICEGTVHRHLHDIYRKLGVHGKEEARRKFGGGVNSCPEERVEQCTVYVPPASLQVVFNSLISTLLWYAQFQCSRRRGPKSSRGERLGSERKGLEMGKAASTERCVGASHVEQPLRLQRCSSLSLGLVLWKQILLLSREPSNTNSLALLPGMRRTALLLVLRGGLGPFQASSAVRRRPTKQSPTRSQPWAAMKGCLSRRTILPSRESSLRKATRSRTPQWAS